MPARLRDSWRSEVLHTIQGAALDLFDERGFAAVKISDVAGAAGVSSSSVYRYFGTKEGLIVADEFDHMDASAIGDLFDLADPVGSMIAIVQGYEAPAVETSSARSTASRRIHYFFNEPSVRAAVCANLDRAAGRMTPLLARGMSLTRARALAHALAFAYFGALEQWHLDGGIRPIAEYVEDGLSPLRSLWPSASERTGGR